MTKKISTILVKFFIIFFITKSSFAENKEKEAKDFVSILGNKIIQISKEKSSEEIKKNKIISIIDSAIDSDWIARFVLGKNFKIMNDQQKNKFSELYREFMIKTYGPKFKNYNGNKFEVKSVVKQNSFYIVKTEFLPIDAKVAILIDFRIKEKNNSFVVLDFIAEGISLIETQRSEFNSAISQKGVDKFLQDLEERNKKL
jgi:phospholipid transport system substrate-binding protein